MQRLQQMKQESFALPPSAPFCTQNGDELLSIGADNAVKVIWYATGKAPYATQMVDWDNLAKIGGLPEKTLDGLASYATNLALRKGSRIPDKESLRLVMSLAHYLTKDDAPAQADYIQSGRYFRDSIEIFLKEMDMGPLVPPEEIPDHLKQLNRIAEKQNQSVGRK